MPIQSAYVCIPDAYAMFVRCWFRCFLHHTPLTHKKGDEYIMHTGPYLPLFTWLHNNKGIMMSIKRYIKCIKCDVNGVTIPRVSVWCHFKFGVHFGKGRFWWRFLSLLLLFFQRLTGNLFDFDRIICVIWLWTHKKKQRCLFPSHRMSQLGWCDCKQNGHTFDTRTFRVASNAYPHCDAHKRTPQPPLKKPNINTRDTAAACPILSSFPERGWTRKTYVYK